MCVWCLWCGPGRRARRVMVVAGGGDGLLCRRRKQRRCAADTTTVRGAGGEREMCGAEGEGEDRGGGGVRPLLGVRRRRSAGQCELVVF